MYFVWWHWCDEHQFGGAVGPCGGDELGDDGVYALVGDHEWVVECVDFGAHVGGEAFIGEWVVGVCAFV